MSSGTKVDIRDEVEAAISKEEGAALARQIKARGYYECSAKTLEGVSEVCIYIFLSIISIVLRIRPIRLMLCRYLNMQ